VSARPAARRGPGRGKPSTPRRIRVLIGLTALFLLVALARAVQLQAVDHPAFAARALDQHRTTITLHAARGEIVDRRGRRLAVSEEAVTIGAYPREISQRTRVAVAVANATGQDPGLLADRLRNTKALHIDLVRQADPEAAQALKDKNIRGLTFTPEERRVYPSGIAAQVIGTVDIESKGLAGLENEYDGVLRGRDGREEHVRDPQGDTISVVSSQPAHQGETLALTLDRDIQAIAEEVLRRTQETSKAKGVTAVILDPSTGGVLAMASSPGPGADGYRKATADEQRIRAITDQYEPGSTFKAVTVAAGLAEKRFGPLTRIEVPSVFKLYEYPLVDADPDPGTKTVADILKVSSNVGTARLAYEYLGGSRGDSDHGRLLAKWIDRLGFGARTGIDLPGETAGAVLPYNRWSGTSILNIPIGYGTAVTPIQLASLYATIANGGIAVRPHLAARVGDRPPIQPKAKRLLPERVAKQLTQMLIGVVQEDGTGHQAAIPGYTVAGKTGTTKKIDPDGTYSDSRYVAWFVGFAPASHPKVVTLVMVDEPQGDRYYGGEVAAPAFAELTSRALLALGVQRDRSIDPAADAAREAATQTP